MSPHPAFEWELVTGNVGDEDLRVALHPKSAPGVQATHLALALSIADITDRADVYIGSWSDWITSPDRPIALG